MKKIILLRHGESLWNLENRFTGWTDVELTPHGRDEALEAGDLLRNTSLSVERAYTSYLKRAIETLNCVLQELDCAWIPVEKSWRLNEKHYGALQGLNKKETAEKYGEEQVKIWRRSYHVAPPALRKEDPRNPCFDVRYREVPTSHLPLTESLADTVARLVPYWEEVIFPQLEFHDTLLVVAHGNSLRGIIKYVKQLSDEAIVEFNLPTAVPYVMEFDDRLLKFRNDYFLGDPDLIQRKIGSIVAQGRK